MTNYDLWRTNYPFTPMPDIALDAESRTEHAIEVVLMEFNRQEHKDFRTTLVDCDGWVDDDGDVQVEVKLEFVLCGDGGEVKELACKLVNLGERLMRYKTGGER
jgi:hypothetical protein